MLLSQELEKLKSGRAYSFRTVDNGITGIGKLIDLSHTKDASTGASDVIILAEGKGRYVIKANIQVNTFDAEVGYVGDIRLSVLDMHKYTNPNGWSKDTKLIFINEGHEWYWGGETSICDLAKNGSVDIYSLLESYHNHLLSGEFPDWVKNKKEIAEIVGGLKIERPVQRAVQNGGLIFGAAESIWGRMDGEARATCPASANEHRATYSR
jgi:hypothetical protein